MTTSYCERQELANKDGNTPTDLVKMTYCDSDTVYDYQVCLTEDPLNCRITAEWPLERTGGAVLGGACKAVDAVDISEYAQEEDSYYMLTCVDSVITYVALGTTRGSIRPPTTTHHDPSR